MVGADQQAAQVGDDQAHEGDGAGDRHRRTAQDHGACRGDQPRAQHVFAEAGRNVVAECQRVHAARAHESDRRADREHRQDRRDTIPGRAADPADLPEAEDLEEVHAGEENRAHERHERRRRRRAGERQSQRCGPAAAERADRVDEDRGAAGADDRGRDEGVGVRHAEERDADDYGERGPARYPENARIRERVAGHRLHGGARHRQCRADEDREHGPGHPRDHGGLRDASGATAEPRDDVAERDVADSEGDARDAQHREHRGRHREPGQSHRCRTPQGCGIRHRRARLGDTHPIEPPAFVSRRSGRRRAARSTGPRPSRSTAATGWRTLPAESPPRGWRCGPRRSQGSATAAGRPAVAR